MGCARPGEDEYMLNQTEVKYHVRSRIRAYGKARIDIARRAKTRQDWDTLWKRPQFEFPFEWGPYWKQCIEYRVDDFAAEVGFFIDMLGLPVNAFNPDYAMFTSPQGDFYFSVVQAPEDGNATPPDAFRLQFMVEDVFETAAELERRGIVFDQPPQPVSPNSSVCIGYFRTPHGISVDLWGIAAVEEVEPGQPDPVERPEVVPADAEELEPEDQTDGYTVDEEPVETKTEANPASDSLDELDDLFEEVKDEPAPRLTSDKVSKPSTWHVNDAPVEPEYVNVDESEEDFPAYKPIPLNH